MALSGRGTSRNRKQNANNCERRARNPKQAITLPIQNRTKVSISSESQFEAFECGDHVANRVAIAASRMAPPVQKMLCLELISNDLLLNHINATANGTMSSRCV